MTVLSDIALIGAPSSRAKSYLQMLVKSSLFVSKFYILSHSVDNLIALKNAYIPAENVLDIFNHEEPLLYTLEKNKIPYEVINSEDINSPLLIDKIKNIQETYLIYSGYPGQLVKEEVLNLGKKFIHVHAGMLPEYRGSTTAYYSILKEKSIGASAIFLSPGIDEGNVIECESYPFPPTNVNIDHVYEPYIRSKVLIKCLEYYAKNKTFKSVPQFEENAKTYFIIHPVLKHIAILANYEY